MSKKSRIVFKTTGWKIDLDDCDYVAEFMPQIAPGWGVTRTKLSKTKKNLRSKIKRNKNNTWTWTTFKHPQHYRPRDWDRIPPPNEMRVLTDVHEAAIHWYLEDNPNLLSLHCASAKIGGGMLVFPARGRAGKSTLMAALAARGVRLFGDDVMLVNRGRAMSYGFAPRLRVPLPTTLSAELKTYIDQNTVTANRSWIYLNPGDKGLAPLGETAPIKAFILLERTEDGPTRLEPAREVDVLKSLVLENIFRTLSLHIIFDRMQRLCKNKPRFKLSYSNTDDAADFLCKSFGAT